MKKALYQYGGIYLDTDVEVLKSFDDLLSNSFFAGYIFDCLIGTAVIGAEKKSPIIYELMKYYETDDCYSYVPNNHLMTSFFLSQSWFHLNGKTISYNGIVILRKEELEQPSFRNVGYSVHHNVQSWRNHERGKILMCIRKVIGETLYRKISSYYSMKMNPYYQYFER